MLIREDCDSVMETLVGFADSCWSGEGPVIRQPSMAELSQTLELDRWIAAGGLNGADLQAFLTGYLDGSTRLRNPRNLAHQVAIPEPLAVLGALIDAFVNNPMAVYELGPAAATVERVMLNWMLTQVGWRSPGAAGVAETSGGGAFTHGGSLANLTGLAAARSRIAPNAWRDGTPQDLVVVAAPLAHYCIARATGLLGLGTQALRAAPADALGRLDPVALGPFLDDLRAQGLRVMAVVASACCTAAGLYDPLRAVATVCQARGVWLHVDGAHGAPALVSPRLRRLLDGVELADSLAWDAHKMMRTPGPCSAVLTRDARDLDAAFHEEASYLFFDPDHPGFDFIHRTVECTKAALGLKAFCALASEGEAGLAAYLESRADLARDAAAYLRAQPDVEVAVEPDFNILCFRLQGDDAFQLKLRKKLTEIGEYYVSSTEYLGRRWLRMTLVNPRSTLEHVKGMLAALRTLAADAQ